jgi:putative flippase GtrA
MPGADPAREGQPAAARGPTGVVQAIAEALNRHRILRFVLVGGVNTCVGLALFYGALAVLPTTFSALVVSTLLAIIFNFFSTGSYVFRSRDPRRIGRFFAVYGVVFVYNAVGLALLERAGIDPRIGAILLLPGAVIISYVLNRTFVFGAQAGAA